MSESVFRPYWLTSPSTVISVTESTPSHQPIEPSGGLALAPLGIAEIHFAARATPRTARLVR